jgi:hypothetical protein
MIEKTIEDQGREVQRRLYAHHDYFGNIIPSSWFLTGAMVGAFVFYRRSLATSLLSVRTFLVPLGEPSTAVDVVIAITLAILLFNLVYITGQLLNGVGSVVLDRLIVKKLLHYPFTLYELKWKNRDAMKTDTEIFREAMVDATYAVFCVNLVPVVFFEFALVAFGRQNPHAGSWVQRNPVLVLFLSILLVIVHFGVPSIRKAREVCLKLGDPTAVTELVVGHVAVILISAVTIASFLVLLGWSSILLILPAANFAMAFGDRRMLLKFGSAYRSQNMKRVFVYARRTFVNPAYFAAKIVGYGSSPTTDLLGKAFIDAKYDSHANDFYWMCQLRLENDAPRSYDTAYHGMAMYTMNRNLCNATAFIVILSLVAFYVRWPQGVRHSALIWVAGLCVLTYAFFVRYLYLFSGLYSKYVVRTAAFLSDRKTPHLVRDAN